VVSYPSPPAESGFGVKLRGFVGSVRTDFEYYSSRNAPAT
jgi:hypothetical protein